MSDGKDREPAAQSFALADHLARDLTSVGCGQPGVGLVGDGEQRDVLDALERRQPGPLVARRGRVADVVGATA